MIKHKTIFTKDWVTSGVKRKVYLCNWACGTTPEKSSYRWNKVTCKNCLKLKPTQNPKKDSAQRET